MILLNLRRHAVKAWRRTATKRVFASYDASQRELKNAVHSFAVTLRERGKEAVTFIF